MGCNPWLLSTERSTSQNRASFPRRPGGVKTQLVFQSLYCVRWFSAFKPLHQLLICKRAVWRLTSIFMLSAIFLVTRYKYWLWLELSNGTWNLIGLEHLDPSHLINYTCQNVYTFLTPVKDCCHALFAGQQNKKVVIIFTKFSSQNPETKEVQSYSTMDFIYVK